MIAAERMKQRDDDSDGDAGHLSAGAPSWAQRHALRNRPEGLAVMRQQWAGLMFYHWRVDPAVIARRLPMGLYADTFDGSAWLGVVPFFMKRVRPTGLPPLPWFSWFLELNVRTYVHDGAGRPGVWFFSLDCNQPVAVELARRWFHLPYEHATMRAARGDDGMIAYECRRKGAKGVAACRYPAADAAACAPARQGSLEWFLVERYLLFAADRRGRLSCGLVHHEPYRIMEVPAEPGTVGEAMRWNGFEMPNRAPDSALTAKAVDVSVFPLRGL
jgi:uncharacterized protein YqjF (DUF2071 family)